MVTWKVGSLGAISGSRVATWLPSVMAVRTCGISWLRMFILMPTAASMDCITTAASRVSIR